MHDSRGTIVTQEVVPTKSGSLVDPAVSFHYLGFSKNCPCLFLLCHQIQSSCIYIPHPPEQAHLIAVRPQRCAPLAPPRTPKYNNRAGNNLPRFASIHPVHDVKQFFLWTLYALFAMPMEWVFLVLAAASAPDSRQAGSSEKKPHDARRGPL
jgi:hypothetical protein